MLPLGFPEVKSGDAAQGVRASLCSAAAGMPMKVREIGPVGRDQDRHRRAQRLLGRRAYSLGELTLHGLGEPEDSDATGQPDLR